MSDYFKSYLDNIPPNRAKRLTENKNAFLKAQHKAKITNKYKMPTFEMNDNWVCLGNQKHYISIYFCQESLIQNIIKNLIRRCPTMLMATHFLEICAPQ